MSERYSLHLLNSEALRPLGDEVQTALAQRAQALVNQDFARFTTPELAQAIANPDDKDQVRRQLARMHYPSVPYTRYLGYFAEGQLDPEAMEGFIKVSPWLPGDAKPFGAGERMMAFITDKLRAPEGQPRGLGVFSVREGLALAALTAVRLDSYVLPPTAQLNAAVHTEDVELHAALSALGASEEGPMGQIKLEGYEATYQLRTLPPHSSAK